MIIPFSLVKYIAIWNAVFWPLHYLDVRNGIAEIVATIVVAVAWEILRRRRKRRWYENLAMQQLAQEAAAAEDVSKTTP